MEKLPVRRSNRLPEYDYSQNGAYFVTICTEGKKNIFGTIINGEMHHTEVGKIALQQIVEISSHRQNVEICKAVVMPNHVHILLMVRRGMTCHARDQARQFGKPVSNGLGMIVGAYKAAVTRMAHENAEKAGMTSHAPTNSVKIWQRGFHDHVVRNDADFRRIWTYIDENPLKWDQDCYFISE